MDHRGVAVAPLAKTECTTRLVSVKPRSGDS
jgi:hypothetical protein